MALITLKKMLDHAADHGYAVPAFNVSNMEQIQAVMEAAQHTMSPVILQTSASAQRYAGVEYVQHMLKAAVETHPDIPVVLHFDHGASFHTCALAMDKGYTSVMMDGSLLEDAKTPADYEYNVKITSEVVAHAHARGISVEGELGCLGSLETGLAAEEDGSGAQGVLSSDMLLTDPLQARDFCQKTSVDALAVAIGASHGAYKFTKKPTSEMLAIDRLKEIQQCVPDVHLVMHGSSSVPQEWLTIIRQFGGEVGDAFGVPLEDLQRSIRYGVRKINIDTDVRLAMTGAMRQYLGNTPDSFDVRAILGSAKKAARSIAVARMEAFGCSGKAAKV
jgi:fructose-bisphosphate aldolase class II